MQTDMQSGLHKSDYLGYATVGPRLCNLGCATEGNGLKWAMERELGGAVDKLYERFLNWTVGWSSGGVSPGLDCWPVKSPGATPDAALSLD
eukprot:7035638-Karenia_brevis.AAC.1